MRLRSCARALALSGLVVAGGCSRQDDTRTQAVTSDEQQRLNDAAAMLDNQSVSMNAIADDNQEDSQ